jgi:ABC-type maltose transport system permease subunit
MSSFVKDPELCQKYAQFASHMVRWQFKIIYWTLFMSNLVVLFLASWTFTRYICPPRGHRTICRTLANTRSFLHSRGQKAIEQFSDEKRKRSKSLRLYIFLCLGCVAVSTTIVIMEAYSLLALQFCDGEDLMSLYWSTWTMIQVGSLIAMVGIILALAHALNDRKHP